MQLQKLSSNINKRANRSVRMIVTGLCVLAGLVALGIIFYYTIQSNHEQVQLYGSQIDSTMAQ